MCVQCKPPPAECNHRWVHRAARHAVRRFAKLVSLLIAAHRRIISPRATQPRRSAELISLLSAAHELHSCEGSSDGQQLLLQCRDRWRSRRILVIDNIRLEITAVTSQSTGDPARRPLRWLACSWHRSSRRMEGAASACVVNIDSRTKRGSNRVVRRRDGESTILPEFQPKAFEDHQAYADCWKRARVPPDRDDLRWERIRRSEGLRCVRGEGSSGEGLSRSAVTYAAHNTIFTRRGASRRWPPRARLSVSMKGGGHPFAALAVGSRGVGKRKTLDAISRDIRRCNMQTT